MAAWAQNAENPIIWGDVPDPSMIRVGDTYYMVSTTMHMSPGLPIMKSTNLVDWEIVNYAYDRLVENNPMSLNNGEEAYGRGSWASSIKYKDGTFYIHTFSYTSNKSHIYKTTDIENGPFESFTLSSLAHDASLLFDDDGKVYLAYGHDDITLRELNSSATDYQPGGINQTIIENASGVAGSNMILTAEGTQMFKINGWYYVMNICWPSGHGRTVIIHRSRNITGPYEGRVALDDQGVAQGGLISTPSGDWYAYLFQDHGAVGRIPYLVPVHWENDWPVFASVPNTLDIEKETNNYTGIIASDNFETLQPNNHGLKLEWQWNHNPVHDYWSLTERPGFLRLTTDRTDPDFVSTRNSLTQRSVGPITDASIALETAGMQDGDYAGLAALQYSYGFVGVKQEGSSKSIVMVNGTDNNPQEIASVPLDQNRVYFRIRMDFNNRADEAEFYYSLDGESWEQIGNTLQMSFSLEHFMGYRLALFNYATKSAGGYADFDHYIVNNYPFDTLNPDMVHTIPGTIEAENYSSMSGVLAESDENNITSIGWINDEDYTEYSVDVAESGYYSMKVNVATAAESNNSIQIFNETGDSLGSLEVDAIKSDGWHDWFVDSVTLSLQQGEQTLRLKYNGSSEYLFNIDKLEFSRVEDPVSFVFPQSILQEPFTIHIYSFNGEKLLDQSFTNCSAHVKLEAMKQSLRPGIYLAVINTSAQGFSQPEPQIIQVLQP